MVTHSMGNNKDVHINNDKSYINKYMALRLLGQAVISVLISGCATGLLNERVDHVKRHSITGTDSAKIQSQIDRGSFVIPYKGKMFMGDEAKPYEHVFFGKCESHGFVTYLKFGAMEYGNGISGEISDENVDYDRSLSYRKIESGQDMMVNMILSSRDDEYTIKDIEKGGQFIMVHNSTLDRSNRSVRAYYVYKNELYVSKIDVKFSPQFSDQARISLLQTLYLVSVPLDIAVLPLQPLLCYIVLMGRMGDGSH